MTMFGSTIFLFLFLPVTFVVYFAFYLVGKPRLRINLQNGVLLAMSCVFVAWASVKFLMIAVIMTLINYVGGILIGTLQRQASAPIKNRSRKFVLIGLIVVDVLVLGFYKYFPGLENVFSVPFFDNFIFSSIIFPLGISFYTFTLIRYLVDIHSQQIEAEKNFLRFSLFVLFFPKFISGPIERYQHFQGQLRKREFRLPQVYDGVIRFVMGLNKKILLVGILESMSGMVFSLDMKEWTAPLAWAGIFLFGLQLYIDFDSYSDMAIGLGKIFGFELMENFNLPYLAKSVQEFWNRWHISLSKWLQDTILLPFQFQTRRKQPKWVFQVLGLLLTFLVSGLWHGNSWNFVLWGLWHGVFLSLEVLFLKKWLQKLPKLIQHLYLILVVNLGWVFFRLDSFAEIRRFFSVLFIPQKFNGILYRGLIEFSRIDMVLVVGISILISAGIFKQLYRWSVSRHWVFEAGYVVVLFLLLGLSFMQLYNGIYQPFLYAEF